MAARRGAISLLGAVLGEGRSIADSLGLLDALSPQDRARAQRRATEVLRMLERADRLLNKYLQRPPPLFVRNVLRLGVIELCTGEAAHGVVNDMVALVGSHRKHGGMKGLTNAVLRKVAAEGPTIWPTLPTPRLPKPLRKRLVQAWGEAAVRVMETVQSDRPPLDLTPLGDATELADRLGASVLPTGSLRLRAPGQVSKLDGYDTGEWWVQDASAAMPARLLNPAPGDRVLDMCAAPGGKTMQLAAMGAQVTAIDVSEARMKRVTENLARTGLTATCVTGDALAHKGEYDAVLLDAPCSATGTIRRHPDLPYIKTLRDLTPLRDLQDKLIDHAWSLLAPGGRLMFCTCSLLPEEGEDRIQAALTRLDGALAAPSDPPPPGLSPNWRIPAGVRFRPDYWADDGGMDGFFAALLVKSR